MHIPIPALPRAAGWRAVGATTLAALLLVGGCGSSGPDKGVLVRSPTYGTLLEAGMAVAPVAFVERSVGTAEVTRLLSDELFANLVVSVPRAPLVAPDEVAARLEAGGGTDLLRGVRRALDGGGVPTGEDLLALSRVVQHRFLFLPWVEERTGTGAETGASGDYTEQGFANEVQRTAYSRVEGTLEAAVLDLWENEVVWRGVTEYRTDRLYGDPEVREAESERARVGGAARLAALFAAP